MGPPKSLASRGTIRYHARVDETLLNGSLWTDAQRAAWRRIASHSFEAHGTALDFAHRLARDRSWSLDHTRKAIEEYRRFCFLSLVSETPVTPSQDVDEVWHQHLTYSRDYWDIWCGKVLGRRLHHDPTEGGPAEAHRFREQYAATLATYEAWFGPPPEDLWPSDRYTFCRIGPRYAGVGRRRVRRRLLLRSPPLGCRPTSARELSPTARGRWMALRTAHRPGRGPPCASTDPGPPSGCIAG